MKRKVMCFLLSLIMLLSLLSNVFAEQTQVTYHSTGSEKYTVIVPATLNPGQSGTVQAYGTWSSDKTLTVTSDSSVTLVNNISGGDEKVATITFAGIELQGSNTAQVEQEKSISVSNISDALFGTWSGVFNYNIALSENAAPTGIVAGLYDANDSLLCSWTNSGINVEKDYTFSTYKTDIDSPYYIFTNFYPTVESILIPDGVITIGSYAFKDCTNLTSVTIPDSVKYIDACAFDGCSNLTSITISDNVTTIGSSAFSECSNLTSVIIPDGVTKISSGTFSKCTNLTSVVIPDSVTKIENLAFYNCKNLTSIAIPSNVTLIGSQAFDSCSNLTSVTIPDSVTSMRSSAFKNCTNLISVVISNSLEYIPDSAFENCRNLTSIVIPNSVKSIGNSAFRNCNSLNSVSIPEGVTEIGNYAFWECPNLTSLTIPNSVKSIGILALSNQLTSIKWNNNTYTGVDAFRVAFTAVDGNTMNDPNTL